jgi:hypothetical protein
MVERGGSGFALTAALRIQVWRQERYEGREEGTPEAEPRRLARFFGWTKQACGGWGGEAGCLNLGQEEQGGVKLAKEGSAGAAWGWEFVCQSGGKVRRLVESARGPR